MFGSGCNQSLITLTGLHHNAFRNLLHLFEPVYNNYSPYSSDGHIRRLDTTTRQGRPRSMNSEHCLALCLAWTRSKGFLNWMSIVFGVTNSVVSLFIRFGRRMLVRLFSRHPSAMVTMPSEEKVEEFKLVISRKHPSLTDEYCVADGLKLLLEQSGDLVVQSRFYDGWTHSHYVGNVFVFAPNGHMIACTLNAPVCMHKSTIASYGDIYGKLEEIYNSTGGKCAVDSAFNFSFSSSTRCSSKIFHCSFRSRSSRFERTFSAVRRSFRYSYHCILLFCYIFLLHLSFLLVLSYLKIEYIHNL